MREVPPPTSRFLASVYETIRYERGAWPLWRWDLNLRYISKSLLHRPFPQTTADQHHWQAVRAYLAGGTWKRACSRQAHLLLGGDLMWIRSGWATAMSEGVQSLIRTADTAFVNLETPMVPENPVPRLTYETLHYNSDPDYLEAWKVVPTVLSLCNNHAFDQGPAGLKRTRQLLLERGFLPVGGSEPAEAVTALRSGDLQIGVTAFSYGINHLNGDAPAGIPLLFLGEGSPDWNGIAERLRQAREAGPDLVVVMAHWSFEYEYWPDATCREHARKLVELGADLVIGSSPHVLQPVELVSVDGVDPHCPTQASRGAAPSFALIVWSLGNLCSIMPTMPCQLGALLQLRAGRQAEGVFFESLLATPTVCGRGLGDHWLDARTLTLREFAKTHEASAHQAHASLLLGPLESP